MKIYSFTLVWMYNSEVCCCLNSVRVLRRKEGEVNLFVDDDLASTSTLSKPISTTAIHQKHDLEKDSFPMSNVGYNHLLIFFRSTYPIFIPIYSNLVPL